LCLGQSFDHGREIRAGIREQIVDAAFRQEAEEVIGDRIGGLCV
jgi:hypothetical protein